MLEVSKDDVGKVGVGRGERGEEVGEGGAER